jgi:PAS domain S-box-containing protein
MLDFLTKLLDRTEFMPHGYCHYWNPAMLWLHGLSHSVITLAYYSIPITMAYTARKRKDMPFRRQSDERFRGAFDFAAIGMALVAPDGHFLEVNRVLCEIVGYSEEELLAKDFQSIIHPEDLDADPFRRRMLNKEIGHYQMEKRCCHKQGHAVWVLLNVSLVRNARGDPLYFVKQIQDITGRKQIEQQLRRAEEKYRNIFENSTEGIFQMTPEGRLLDSNPALARMLGFEDTEEFLANVTFTDPDAYVDAKCHALLKHKLEERSPLEEFEAEIYRKDGSKRWISINAQVIRDVQGQPVCYQGIGQDTTERKKAQTKLKRSREQLQALWTRLESVREEERTQISREIHDELGQALTSLKIDLSWLEKRIALPGYESSKPMLLDKIQAMSAFASTTLEQVRSIAAKLRPAVLDDLGLKAAIEWEAREFQTRTGIRCVCDLKGQEMKLDPELSTEMFRIYQEAMTNVVRHAQATVVQVVLRKSEGRLLLIVRDNGKGITSREVADPNSLGLLGVRERAHLLGGRIRIRGTEEKGTSVILRVPLTKLASGLWTANRTRTALSNTANLRF